MADAMIPAVDLGGVDPFDPTRFAEPPAGPHEVTITGGEVNAKGNILFETQIPGGMSVGVVLGLDFAKKGNMAHLAALVTGVAQAAGKDPAQVLAAIKVNGLPIAALVGKKAYIHVKLAPEGEVNDKGQRPFPSVNFITKDLAEKLAKNGAASGAKTGGATTTAPGKAPEKPANLGALFDN